MDKSADAFRTISEVADHLETPAHVLRFWESRFPQIKPVKRAGGRRYYRPSDVSLLTGIKRLLHDEGMTIRGVQKILREQGVRHVAGLSGDAVGDDDDGDAPFVDQIDAVVVSPTAQTMPFRPAPGLAEAMAKAVDHGPSGARPVAASTTIPKVEPAQGALLLTPAPPSDVDPVGGDHDDSNAVKPDLEQDVVELGQASPSDDAMIVEAAPSEPPPASTAFPEVAGDAADFEDDDYDDGPVITLASRIRALPPEASASKVAAELVGVVARLQALRDAMADAARTGAA
jgi:DNA-binding transcriptional MerR regulator